MHGKRMVLALALGAVLWAGAADALTNDGLENQMESELMSREERADFRKVMQMYLFGNGKSKEEKHVEPSPEERLLVRWKEKQTDRWESLPRDRFTINASAYTAAADECGKSDGITASGLRVTENRTLACPPQYPFGVKIAIEGYGTYRCEDRGGAIKGNHFDIYMETKREAFAFGRRTLVAQVVFD